MTLVHNRDFCCCYDRGLDTRLLGYDYEVPVAISMLGKINISGLFEIFLENP